MRKSKAIGTKCLTEFSIDLDGNWYALETRSLVRWTVCSFHLHQDPIKGLDLHRPIHIQGGRRGGGEEEGRGAGGGDYSSVSVNNKTNQLSPLPKQQQQEQHNQIEKKQEKKNKQKTPDRQTDKQTDRLTRSKYKQSNEQPLPPPPPKKPTQIKTQANKQTNEQTKNPNKHTSSLPIRLPCVLFWVWVQRTQMSAGSVITHCPPQNLPQRRTVQPHTCRLSLHLDRLEITVWVG